MIGGETALLEASREKPPGSGCAKTLLAAGADPNARDCVGSGVLSHAASADNVETLELMLPHVRDINTQDWDGDTPLCQALLDNHTDALKSLRKADAGIVPSAPGPHCPFLPVEKGILHFGRDAILRAAEDKKFDMVRLLIEAGNHRDPEREYAEAATLLGEGDQNALGKWIQERRDRSPRSDPRFKEMEDEMHQRVREIQYEEFEKHVKAAGRGILYYKHPLDPDWCGCVKRNWHYHFFQ